MYVVLYTCDSLWELSDLAVAISSKLPIPEDEVESDEEDDVEEIVETDQDRRRAMLDATQDAELKDLKYSFLDNFDFKFPRPSQDNDDLATTSRSAWTSIDDPPDGKNKGLLQDKGTSLVCIAPLFISLIYCPDDLIVFQRYISFLETVGNRPPDAFYESRVNF